MAYGQYTTCVPPANYAGPPNTSALIPTLLAIFVNPGVGAFAAILAGIAYCRWWLYGRLVCLGGNKCAAGLALSVSIPELKTGLDREDTDYTVNILLAPSTIYEDLKDAEQDAQGTLIGQSADPAFQTMMSAFKGLGFTGEPVPFSDLVNPEGQSPDAGLWSPNNFYTPGAVIQDNNNNLQSCTVQGLSGGSSPIWGKNPGDATTDGSVEWVCTGPYAVLTQPQLDELGLFDPAVWAANTSYQVGDLVMDTFGNIQCCIIAGTSDSSPPIWKSFPLTSAEVEIQWQSIGWGWVWAPNHNYNGDDLIIDNNGNRQICTVAGTSGLVTPSWETGVLALTSDGTVTWSRGEDLPGLLWAPGILYRRGTRITDGNGRTQTCIVDGFSDLKAPTWATTVGQTTPDGSVIWICVGKFTKSVGTIEVEFEGAGMHDLYTALLAASPVAALAAASAFAGPLGWLASLILSLIAAAIAGIGYLIGQGDTASPDEADSTIGTIYPGRDVLIVMGTWVYDTAHTGWNELHPVLHCQKIAVVEFDDLRTGNPWVNLPQFSSANINNTLNQINSSRVGWCPLIQETLQPTVLDNQKLPQNSWTIHPSVDGCTGRVGSDFGRGAESADLARQGKQDTRRGQRKYIDLGIVALGLALGFVIAYKLLPCRLCRTRS